jgi:hypothetical protein
MCGFIPTQHCFPRCWVDAVLADSEEAGHTTGRVLSWHKPKPGRKLTPLIEGCAVTDRGYDRSCDQRANAGESG